MSDMSAIKKDIEWIKSSLCEHTEALQRIENQAVHGSDRCRERHERIDRELGELSVRAGIAGAIAGLIAGATVFGVETVAKLADLL